MKEKNKGAVLMLAVIASIVLLILGFAYMYIFNQDRLAHIRNRKRTEAFNAAEAGLERARAWLLMVSPSPDWHAQNVLGKSAGESFEPFTGPGIIDGWNKIAGSDFEYAVTIHPDAGNTGRNDKYYVISSTGRTRGIGLSGYYYKPLASGVTVHMKTVPCTGQNEPAGGTPAGADDKYAYPPRMQFINHNNGLIECLATGLMWPWSFAESQVCKDGLGNDTVDWSTANDRLNVANVAVYAGRNDWRLPTVAELTTIMDYSNSWPALPAGVFVSEPTNEEFWTSTTFGVGEYYVVGAVNGQAVRQTSATDYRFFPVAGDVDTYLPLPAARSFTDNGDGTITDEDTGLMWKQSSEAAMTWADALAYARGSDFAGYNDWRVPSIKELISILNYSEATYDYPLFTGDTVSDLYWSSTSYNIADFAWVADYIGGLVAAELKTETKPVRLVRRPELEQEFWKELPLEIH